MEWVETTGRTVEEAKDAALDELGVDEQDAEFELLEEPKLGLFGRVRSEARVRARVRPTAPRPKEDRRDRRRKKTRDGEGERDRAPAAPAAASGGGETATATAEAEERPARRAPARRSSGGGGGGGGGRPPRERRDREQNGSDRPREEGTQVDEDVPMAEQGEVARQFLAGLLTEMGASGEVVVTELDEDTVEVTVTGDDLGTLIGPKGVTLTALQELTRTVVQRRTGGRNGRLLVDVSGYRQKRRQALEAFTRDLAAKVRESGERKVLEPMHPADRKVVHDTVNDLEGVHTISQGEEPRRYVVIVPDES